MEDASVTVVDLPEKILDLLGGKRLAFVSLFENDYGEPWVCWMERGSDTALVWCGDDLWQAQCPNPIELEKLAHGYVLNEAERMWLAACALVVPSRRQWGRIGREKAAKSA